jgi:hypothetical protein
MKITNTSLKQQTQESKQQIQKLKNTYRNKDNK